MQQQTEKNSVQHNEPTEPAIKSNSDSDDESRDSYLLWLQSKKSPCNAQSKNTDSYSRSSPNTLKQVTFSSDVAEEMERPQLVRYQEKKNGQNDDRKLEPPVEKLNDQPKKTDLCAQLQKKQIDSSLDQINQNVSKSNFSDHFVEFINLFVNFISLSSSTN